MSPLPLLHACHSPLLPLPHILLSSRLSTPSRSDTMRSLWCGIGHFRSKSPLKKPADSQNMHRSPLSLFTPFPQSGDLKGARRISSVKSYLAGFDQRSVTYRGKIKRQYLPPAKKYRRIVSTLRRMAIHRDRLSSEQHLVTSCKNSKNLLDAGSC